MSAQLETPIPPDTRAECARCGALVRWERRDRHDRFHDWVEELERRLDGLSLDAPDEHLLTFGPDYQYDPAPDLPTPEPHQAPTEPVAVPPHEPEPMSDAGPLPDDDLRHFSRF